MKKSTVYIILLHLAYWVSPISRFYLLNFRWNAGGGVDFEMTSLAYNIATLLSIVVFYTFYFFIFPKYLYKPNIAKFTFWGCLTIAFAVGFSSFFIQIYSHYFYPSLALRAIIGTGHTGIITYNVASAAVAGCILKGFITWFTEINYKARLEQQNTETNLALIKAKINPHFLFNTLNNIDVLIEKDPATASTYLKKLSDILRFTLYESPLATIPLQKEINYMEQYIELQKIRTSNAGFVKFDANGVANDLQVAPMLFIPFIENAFKYSNNKKIDNAINISLATQGNTITFSCVNIYDSSQQFTGEDGGLGLELIKNRLELLYPKNYKLDIAKTADHFTVNLVVTLV